MSITRNLSPSADRRHPTSATGRAGGANLPQPRWLVWLAVRCARLRLRRLAFWLMGFTTMPERKGGWR